MFSLTQSIVVFVRISLKTDLHEAIAALENLERLIYRLRTLIEAHSPSGLVTQLCPLLTGHEGRGQVVAYYDRSSSEVRLCSGPHFPLPQFMQGNYTTVFDIEGSVAVQESINQPFSKP